MQGAQNVVSARTIKIRFILVFVLLFFSPKRKLNDDAYLYYAGLGKIEAEKMIALARRGYTVNYSLTFETTQPLCPLNEIKSYTGKRKTSVRLNKTRKEFKK